MNLPRLLLRLLLGRRPPRLAGELTVPGVRRPIAIRRDPWGVPHVDAESDADAWFGLGFCHGQDRTFQLEVLLRVIRGTLAELIGPFGLHIDRLSRRIGFARAAPAQWEQLDADMRAMLEAYAAGVCAGTQRGLRRRPHEFVLLRRQPTPWTALDVVAGLKVQGFVLSSNWDVELARLCVLTLDGPEALAALDPAYPSWHPVTAPPAEAAGRAFDRLAEDLDAFAAVLGAGGMSNNWAVAAGLTATGRPLVANDPHLPPTLPPHWYLAHLRTPEWAVAGASFVGGPAIAVGHNDHAAWGVTAALIDNTDLFLEKTGPDGRSVLWGEKYVPCEVRQERIAVRGGPAVTEEVLVTPRGPVIGPALEGEHGAISLRAVWLDPLPVRGLLCIHRATTFEEARRELEHWPTLPLNLVWADRSGQVAWQLIGRAPRRRKGWGTLPLPGWDTEAGWDDRPVPFDEMPRATAPACGFVATANNQPLPEGDGPFLGVDWLDGYRVAAIAESLQRRQDWDVAGSMALQMDQRTLAWGELREVLLAAPPVDADAQLALDLLRGWGGRVAADSPAAAVYELFLAEMKGRVVRAKAPRSFDWALGRGFGVLLPNGFLAVRRTGHLVRLLRDQPAGWFARPWGEEIADTLATVVRRLRADHGPDPDRWAWGRVRPLTLKHLIERRPPLDRIFNLGPIPWGGDANTIGQASVLPLDPTGDPGYIASLRMVADVGAWENSRFVLPGGQSGNPFSPHYADQLPLWQRGDGIPIPWSEEAVAAATCHTLRLYPTAPAESAQEPGRG